MIKAFLFGSTLSLLFSSPLYAEQASTSTLLIPEELELLYLDGKQQSRSIFSFGDNVQPLTLGQHQVVVSYDQIWDLGAEDHERISSESMMIVFTVEHPGEYQLLLPELKTLSDAIEYVKQPTLMIINSQNLQLLNSDVTLQGHGQKMLAKFKSSDEDPPAKPIEMLYYWWNKADAQEKQRFLQDVSPSHDDW